MMDQGRRPPEPAFAGPDPTGLIYWCLISFSSIGKSLGSGNVSELLQVPAREIGGCCNQHTMLAAARLEVPASFPHVETVSITEINLS